MATPAPPSGTLPVTSLLPLAALLLGAVAMGASPLFVRLADIGPITSAFYRVALAVPLLLTWARFELRRQGKTLAWRDDRGTHFAALAGLVFAGDLLFWHLAIMNTSIANATFLATMAPVWVLLLSGLLIGERVGRSELLGLLLCMSGGVALVGGSLQINPANLRGDLFGFITSFFFGLYFLCVRMARREGASTALIMAISAVVTASLLGVAAFVLEDQLWPLTLTGVAALFALAWFSHIGGQSLLAFALGYLPAAFSSLVIFMEAIAAAALAWLILGETLSALQWLGGAAIFVGVAIARPKPKPADMPS
jgi:drug/metabolite transporter (DMT)-like permease